MRELSVAIPGVLDSELRTQLIRADGQEDLCFALWYPSQGERRYSALINKVILPEKGDRQVHGNVSFNQQFLERACRVACAAGMGLAFLHSHPVPGWQGMSPDDIVAEKQMMIPVIDGGIQVRFKAGEFSGADWQLQTVGPGRPCLECLGTFTASDVETEKAGMLEDPKYMDNLPADHRFKNNENVFPFSANLASLEVFQLIALATGAAMINET